VKPSPYIEQAFAVIQEGVTASNETVAPLTIRIEFHLGIARREKDRARGCVVSKMAYEAGGAAGASAINPGIRKT
jgi:hypothetical protein